MKPRDLDDDDDEEEVSEIRRGMGVSFDSYQ